jgi:thioredoxin 1
MEIKKITSSEEFEKAIENGVALIDFNAPWCAPCRVQEPIIDELSMRFESKAIIAEMNIDENREAASKLGIRNIPTLIVFKNGKEVQRFIGLQSKQTLKEALEETLN